MITWNELHKVDKFTDEMLDELTIGQKSALIIAQKYFSEMTMFIAVKYKHPEMTMEEAVDYCNKKYNSKSKRAELVHNLFKEDELMALAVIGAVGGK